jgi:hypothetical protein
MAESLIIKDGYGAIKSLTVESASTGLIPVHYVTSSTSAPVYITASSANPIPVTGTIAVDVTVGDIINVTASTSNPVAVTGTVTNNPSLQATYTTSTYTANTIPTQLVGINGYKATVDTSGRLVVTGTVNINNSSLSVTSSLLSPVYALAATPPVTTVTTNATTSFVWNTIASGTFNIASNSLTRKGLTIFNPGPHNLYVVLSTIGGGGDSGRHGFTIVNTASAPSIYSFIVYPSGTYVAPPTTVGVYHGGYFISGSASVGVFDSEIS